MGMIIHTAIVVTGSKEERASDGEWTYDHLEELRAYAYTLGLDASELIEAKTNGYASFMIATDGSKLGWETNDEAELARAKFKKALQDWPYLVEWAEVRYGFDAESGPRIRAGTYHEGDGQEP